MTPEQIALVTGAVAALRPRMDEVADDFYSRLFERHPELRELFSTDMSLQRRKFADELEMIVFAIPDFGSFLERARQLGARHATYGVRVADYTRVRDVLFEAIADGLGDGWTDETRAAWHSAYNLITEAMLLGGAAPATTGRVRGRE
ncbi:globin domain-containing protein [Planotetraspora sp. A-T 1434]|uniref:globin domain-containing protein n=1 Tax=Planotetraspora sp. A-T 1434 TaxID=2979219 RepID=UPI0021BE2729|nr:globin domain-containing protein [Planotetraspora sp. A-T 1434]MCT9931182.1 globin domain-containing protein [Planotetraspora sp. A-T 1434]